MQRVRTQSAHGAVPRRCVQHERRPLGRLDGRARWQRQPVRLRRVARQLRVGLVVPGAAGAAQGAAPRVLPLWVTRRESDLTPPGGGRRAREATRLEVTLRSYFIG